MNFLRGFVLLKFMKALLYQSLPIVIGSFVSDATVRGVARPPVTPMIHITTLAYAKVVIQYPKILGKLVH